MSRWRQTTMEVFMDVLRTAAGVFLVVDGIMLAGFSVWFVAMFLWRLHGWLARVMFSAPW